MKAITNGNLAVVKQMLDYGLNVNYIYDKEQNYSFLHLACLMGHSKVIKYFILLYYINPLSKDHNLNQKKL